MIKLKVLLCADSIVRDSQTNQISVFNIFEQFTPVGLPALVPRFSVLVVLERCEGDPQTADCTLSATIGDRTLFNVPIRVDFQQGLLSRGVTVFEGFLLPIAGNLKLSFRIGEEESQSYTLRILPPPARPAMPTPATTPTTQNAG